MLTWSPTVHVNNHLGARGGWRWPRLTEVQLSWTIVSKVALADNTQPAGGEQRARFKGSLYLSGLKNTQYLCLISYGQISITWPSPNARGAGKYVSELGSERKGNKLGEEPASLYHRVLKNRFWGIIPGDPHSDLTRPQKSVFKPAKWFWCIPKLGITGLGSKELGANRQNISMKKFKTMCWIKRKLRGDEKIEPLCLR